MIAADVLYFIFIYLLLILLFFLKFIFTAENSCIECRISTQQINLHKYCNKDFGEYFVANFSETKDKNKNKDKQENYYRDA